MGFKKQLALRYIRTKFKLLSSLSKRKAAERALALFFTPQHRHIKKLPAVFEQAKKIQFTFQAETIQGYHWQRCDKKILILHGFESTVVNFEKYMEPLMEKGYEVFAFDAPAHGRSTGKLINAIIYKDFLHHLYKSYGPFDAYIAHSLGGLAVSLFLEEQSHTRDTKCVLIAPATETTTAINQAFAVVKLDNRVRQEFDQLIEEVSGHPPQWFSVTRAITRINASVLWIHDTDDHMTPYADADKVQQLLLPYVTFHTTHGLGHRRIYRDNEVIKTIMKFL